MVAVAIEGPKILAVKSSLAGGYLFSAGLIHHLRYRLFRFLLPRRRNQRPAFPRILATSGGQLHPAWRHSWRNRS